MSGRALFRKNPKLAYLEREIFAVDAELKDKEENFGECKRTQVKEWNGLIFSALLECSEKGTVIAMLGRTIIGNFFTATTRPSLPQAHSSDKSQIEPLGVEAGPRLDNIFFPAGRVGDEAELPSNEDDADGIPRSSLQAPPNVPPNHNAAVESQRVVIDTRSQHPHPANTTRGQIQPDLELVDQIHVHSPCSTLTISTS